VAQKRQRGEEEMIDPLTALAGIQSAISMVKKASAVANDLGSLAPMIGKLFDAKSTATKALIETKKTGGKSNMGTALQIEMALEQARAFEEELKMLFMQTGKIDVWNKIKSRQEAMDADDAQEIRLFNANERQRKQKEAEMNELAVILGSCAFVLFLLFIGGYELLEFCQTGNRCGR
jgi:hypothetical protein